MHAYIHTSIRTYVSFTIPTTAWALSKDSSWARRAMMLEVEAVRSSRSRSVSHRIGMSSGSCSGVSRTL